MNFKWDTNHNVVEVPCKDSFNACKGFTDTTPHDGPEEWKAPDKEKTYYLVCGVGKHCEDGNQKIAITVKKDCWKLCINSKECIVGTPMEE